MLRRLMMRARECAAIWLEAVFSMFYYHEAAILLTVIPITPFIFTALIFNVSLWPVTFSVIKAFFLFLGRFYYLALEIAVFYGLFGLLPIVAGIILFFVGHGLMPMAYLYCFFERFAKKLVTKAIMS